MGSNPAWTRPDELSESGDSGISAAAMPDGKHAWICFKQHKGRSNLIYHWKTKDNANCWSDNHSIGKGGVLHCHKEAAMVYSSQWV